MLFMPPTDSVFLLAESREHPMHVGGLQLFAPPEGSGPEFVRDMLATFRATDNIAPRFRRRPAEPVGSLGNAFWTMDDSIDFDYHIRHSAVPGPGRIRELFQLTSRWHGSLLDRHRPLWECHVVEGLKDGRVAVYTKVHHALIDGVAASRLFQESMSEDPNFMGCPAPWTVGSAKNEPDSSGGLNPMALVRSGLNALGGVLGMGPASYRMVNQIVRDGDMPRAPHTMLNGPVGGARRFAAQSWEIDRIKRVARSSGTTLNDVVLAMVSGSLRDYLLEQHALPAEPMSAMVPVSLTLRSESAGKHGAAGNSVGAIIVNLATDRSSGATRLEEIAYSSRQAKRLVADLTPAQFLAFSALQLAPLALGPIPGFVNHTRPPFNVIVSNVPGPSKQMYFNGAKLDGAYPVSVVLDGQAVNFTLASRDKYLDFGIVGCRKSVPHLQRFLIHLDKALVELEKSWG